MIWIPEVKAESDPCLSNQRPLEIETTCSTFPYALERLRQEQAQFVHFQSFHTHQPPIPLPTAPWLRVIEKCRAGASKTDTEEDQEQAERM